MGPALTAALPAIISGGANLLSSVFGGIFGSSSNSSTNETNLQIARENNALSRQMFYDANQFNAAEAEKSRQFNFLQAQLDRDFQAGQAQLNRDFESIGSQVQRAMDAGVPPSAIISGGMGSSPVQPSSNAASSSPASASGLPHLVTPQMISNADVIQKAFAQAANTGLMIAQTKNIEADTKKEQAETDKLQTYNEFARQIYELGIQTDQQTLKNLYETNNKIVQETNAIKQGISESRARIDELVASKDYKLMLKAGQEIENKFKEPYYTGLIQNLASQTSLNFRNADILVKRLALDQAIGAAQIQYFGALKDYYGSQVELAGKLGSMYQSCTRLYNAQTNRERYGYLLDLKFGADERKTRLQAGQEEIKKLEWQNSDIMRTIEASGKVITTIGTAAAAGFGAYFGFKGMKGPAAPSAPVVYGKNGFTPTNSNWTPIQM